MATKRKLSTAAMKTEEPVDPSEELLFLCLGGGNEVGRSCHIIQYKGKTVMLDAGQHPAYEGLASLPYFDEFDLSTVDILLISHFHVDHAASLPYVLAKTNFQGRVFMTHPTKAIYRWLIQDSVRVGNTSSSSDHRTQLYTEADHFTTFSRIEAIDYYTTHTISSIRITPYPAGHVLGAAMFLIEIAGLKILFTGDYSREEDRHLISAEVPKNVKIDVLITESTYGIASHVPRVEREAAMMRSITGILNRGGKVLMPVFALGRAQEILLILDEYWSRHPEYQRIPIYYASNLARKCMSIYQAYIGAMNDNIKRMFQARMAEAEQAGDVGKVGPWDFRHIRSLKNLERFDDAGGCVVLASPGMLQNGVSRELLERWAPSEKNGVVITGYSVEGTMAKDIMKEPEEIPAIMGNRSMTLSRTGRLGMNPTAEKPMIPRRCSVQEFSFGAHVDGQENLGFIEQVKAPVVILVHGERHNMMRLKSRLLSLNNERKEKTRIYSPMNTEEVRIPFKVDKTAKVVGRLAQVAPPRDPETDAPQTVSGVLVQNDFKLSLMAPEDLREYAGLTTTTVVCRQRVTLRCASTELIRWALEGTFGTIEELPFDGGTDEKEAAEGKDEKESKSRSNGFVDDDDDDDDEDIPDADKEVELKRNKRVKWLIMGCVKVTYENRGELMVEWEGNILNDGLADAVMAVLFSVESSPAAIMRSYTPHSHSHSHSHSPSPPEPKPARNPHADITPEQRFSRLCMFLEAQFGENITPIPRPNMKNVKRRTSSSGSGSGSTSPFKSKPLPPPPSSSSNEKNGIKPDPDGNDGDDDDAGMDIDATLAELEAAELARLHAAGIPVPGVQVRVDDKHSATVWLETLEVESSSAVFGQRVKAVVERAVETIAPLWSAV